MAERQLGIIPLLDPEGEHCPRQPCLQRWEMALAVLEGALG